MYHIASLGTGGWVTANGKAIVSVQRLAQRLAVLACGRLLAQPDPWRDLSAGRRRLVSRAGDVTYVPLPNVSFAPGPSLPLHYYQSIAVDPRVITLGSRVYVPAYKHDGHGGWFVAQDTGGAINGHHIDVYRSPPASASDPGQYLAGQRIYVIKPRR